MRMRRNLPEPGFPLTGFIAALFVADGRHRSGIYPLSRLHRTFEDLTASLGPLIADILAQDAPGFMLTDTAIIIPVSFAAIVSLEQDCRTRPAHVFDNPDRFKVLLPALQRPALHKLLVLPGHFDRRRGWQLNMVASFLHTADPAAVATFMRLVNVPIDARARLAAFYKIGEPVRLNWRTGEVGELRSEPSAYE